MLQPQSDDEIRPIVAELRRLDERLDIRWNPRAKVNPGGGFDVYGNPNPAFRIEGRWEVILSRSDGQPPDVVYQVRWDGDGKEAYRPVGWWLVEFMRRWDSTQAHFRAEWEKAWAEHDAVEQRGQQLDDAATQEFLDEMAFDFGGPYWIGRGAEFNEHDSGSTGAGAHR